MKQLILTLFVLSIGVVSYSQIEHVYDFNNLEPAALNGQDDWVTIQQTTGSGDFYVDYSAGDVVSPDGTLAIFYSDGGPGVGHTATRKASSNFDFDFTEPGTVELEIEMHGSWWGNFFGVGFDADGDNHIAPGLDSEPDDGGIQVNFSNHDPSNNHISLPNGESVIFTATLGGWTRYKMILNFETNDGEGSVALFYDNGVTGDWVAVSEVQGVNMGLTPGSGDKRDRTTWDGIFVHSQGGVTGVDNIIVRETTTTGEPQFIDFSQINTKLITDDSFELEASASSGLPVSFQVLEGPADVNGNTLTLSGETGFVTVAANQAGDSFWAAAPQVTQTFEVIDANDFLPQLTIRRPADDTEVFMEELSDVVIVASVYIGHPEVLGIKNVMCDIDGETIELTEKNKNTGYYNAIWKPESFGVHTMTVTATSTENDITTQTVSFNVTNDISDMTIQTFESLHLQHGTPTGTQEFAFPTFAGAFDQITAFLDVNCPAAPQDCDPWDRVANMEVKGPNGEWIEIFRYITPYGVACDHQMDATDYASLLQGLVEMRFTLDTYGDGFLIDVNFDFQAGTPAYKYSWVDVIWRGIYPFGDYENLQPVEVVSWKFADVAESAKLKINNTGHSWGDLNSGNAAEFYEATHKIKVNGTAFDQHLWVECNPNPDGCQPQNGTWYYDRAGWCPGSIGYIYNYDLDQFVNAGNAEFEYEFYTGYVDYCHPNHPDCVTGVTCSDCDDPSNPHYIIAGNLVTYSNALYIPTSVVQEKPFGVSIYPNPSSGAVILETNKTNFSIHADVTIYSNLGQILDSFEWDGSSKVVDLTTYARGVYFIKIQQGDYVQTERVVLQ